MIFFNVLPNFRKLKFAYHHCDKRHFPASTTMTTTTECCICYSTTEDINAKYAASFVTIPCGGKHIVCFPCFIQTQNGKCPMCRYDYVDGVKRDDEDHEAAQLEEETHLRREEQWCYYDHGYTFYQDLNREFDGDYQQAVDEAARNWKDFARLDKITQDAIYEKLEQATIRKFYIYRQLRDDMRHNEDGIMRIFDSSFDVSRVIYLSRIISQPDNEDAYQRLNEYEEWVDEELEIFW